MGSLTIWFGSCYSFHWYLLTIKTMPSVQSQIQYMYVCLVFMPDECCEAFINEYLINHCRMENVSTQLCAHKIS
jgi:hypothetical protein